MPIYEYRCLKCGNVKEVLQKLSDGRLRKCGLCSGKLEKLISRTSFQLKGGGWFAHGYGSPGSDAAKSAKDSPGDKASSGSSKKEDSGGSKKKKSKATG